MKKVLVSTIPSWSQQSGANTFSSLLDGIEDVDISSIYFRSDIPDSKVAKHYFHIIHSLAHNTFGSVQKPKYRSAKAKADYSDKYRQYRNYKIQRTRCSF